MKDHKIFNGNAVTIWDWTCLNEKWIWKKYQEQKWMGRWGWIWAIPSNIRLKFLDRIENDKLIEKLFNHLRVDFAIDSESIQWHRGIFKVWIWIASMQMNEFFANLMANNVFDNLVDRRSRILSKKLSTFNAQKTKGRNENKARTAYLHTIH